MRRALFVATVVLAGIAASLTIAACGSSNEGKSGGKLTVMAADDVDYLDPGAAYYQFSYMVLYATQRPLFSWKPDDVDEPSPDLATKPADISDDGKTVTVTMRDDVKFSPPVNRAATSEDVKYAIERAFTPGVANGYVTAYMADLVGLKKFQDGDADQISGIETPSKTEIVFKLNRGTGSVLAQALSLPVSTPVPKAYAKKYDARNPSTYGDHQVFTGPYMIDDYQAGKSIVLKRNPSWDKSTDYRPAYLDQIEVSEGNSLAVASRQILNGDSMVNGDFAVPPPAVLKQALTRYKDQTDRAPSGGNRYVALNTQMKPFDDLNVRKAILAASNRNALRLTRGGESVGPIATHFIPTGVPGFDEAGGEGTDFDFLKNPEGDAQLAASYMRKAGYKSGKYDGNETFLMIGDNEAPGNKTSEVARDQLEQLGFKIKLRQVSRDAVYTKFCGQPDSGVAICATVGWAKDFNDGETILAPTFDGDNIQPEGNVNWPQLDNKEINKEINDAKVIVGAQKRADAWGKIDKMITAQAPAIPWVWDDNINIRSSNVDGVVNKFNASYDLSFTSLK